nr:hypothetical protein [uncultured Fluviicola sp.]
MLLLLIFCIGCKQEKNGVVNHQSGDFEREIQRIEPLLPNSVSNDKYVFIWRMGSIQLAECASVIAVEKKNLNTKGKVSCLYFVFDSPRPQNLDAGIVSSIYEINISIDELLHINKNQKDLYTIDKIASKYCIDEGFCSNFFFVKEFQATTFISVNSDKYLSEKIANIFSQINPREHLQSLTLINKCMDEDLIDSIYKSYKTNQINGKYLMNNAPIYEWDKVK